MEAALVLPIFIFAILAFIYLLQFIQLQEVLQNAITETGFYAAKYAYVYDYFSKNDNNLNEDHEKSEDNNKVKLEDSNKGKSEDSSREKVYKTENSGGITNKLEETKDALIAHSIDSTFYKLKLRDYLDVTMINNSLIKDGYDGIHMYLSSFMKDDSTVDIILTYKIKLPLLFIEVDDIQVVQRVRMRGWNGYYVNLKNENTDNNKKEDDVYITQTGTVYHLNKECTHLKLSIRSTPFSQIESLRNSNGGKYKKCDLCAINSSSNEEVEVYITNSGDHYHTNLDCSSLKRTILTVPLSDVGERRLCTRCGNGGK